MRPCWRQMRRESNSIWSFQSPRKMPRRLSLWGRGWFPTAPACSWNGGRGCCAGIANWQSAKVCWSPDLNCADSGSGESRYLQLFTPKSWWIPQKWCWLVLWRGRWMPFPLRQLRPFPCRQTLRLLPKCTYKTFRTAFWALPSLAGPVKPSWPRRCTDTAPAGQGSIREFWCAQWQLEGSTESRVRSAWLAWLQFFEWGSSCGWRFETPLTSVCNPYDIIIVEWASLSRAWWREIYKISSFLYRDYLGCFQFEAEVLFRHFTHSPLGTILQVPSRSVVYWFAT